MSTKDYCKRAFYPRSCRVCESHKNKLMYSIPENNNNYSLNTFESKLISKVSISILYILIFILIIIVRICHYYLFVTY